MQTYNFQPLNCNSNTTQFHYNQYNKMSKSSSPRSISEKQIFLQILLSSRLFKFNLIPLHILQAKAQI